MPKADKRRLEKIQETLTPKEIVLLWLKEARDFGSYEEYADWVFQHTQEAPRNRVARDVKRTARAQAKASPPTDSERTLRESIKEADTLVLLALKVNEEIQCLLRHESEEALHLGDLILSMRDREAFSKEAGWTRHFLVWDTPYPIDEATARAVQAAAKHEVMLWDALSPAEDGDTILDDWVDDHLDQTGMETPEELLRISEQIYQSFRLKITTDFGSNLPPNSV